MKNRTLIGLFCILWLSAINILAQPFRLQQNFVTGLSLPVHLTNAKDGTRRIFIVQQRGIIKVLQPGASTTTDFLNISSVVSSSGNERGLLGLAFHPSYASNRRFFVYYTRQSDGAIEIAEYEASAGNPNQANPTAVRIIITIPHPTNSNHNGGTVAFGPDGFLYAATGDGGSGNDPPNNAQNINILLGKFIRIDINTPVGQVPAYNIPPTNPYAGATPGADEIYAIGLRNPYRFSFDRGGTNQLWVGDVGQNVIEEVDIITLGGNYGWRVYEGTQCTGLDAALCIPANYRPPTFEYNRVMTPRCSVTGGYVYRGNQNAVPKGSYIYADYCSGEILMWQNSQQTLLLDTGRFISSFGEDEDGELYVVGLSSGTVDKILGNKTSADFDGDVRTDISVFRPSTGVWYVQNSLSGSTSIQQFGLTGDIPAAEDYDGDFRADLGVFRPSNGIWYFLNSSNNTFSGAQFGTSGDIPAAGDYDGDGKADFTVFRPSTGVWYTFRSSDFGVSVRQFGLSGDRPTAGDFDGDGRYDLAVWRASDGVWYQFNSTTNSSSQVTFGLNGDIPATGDFDGDGRNDQAIYRPSTGFWYLLRSTAGLQITRWGLSEDIPVVGDYDSDGRDDIALFRPSTGVWYALRSTSGTLIGGPFGLSSDLPVASYDNP